MIFRLFRPSLWVNFFCMKNILSSIVAVLLGASGLFAQTGNGDWFNLDPNIDGVYGVSVNEAYKQFNGLKIAPVIVAVLDDGVDIYHSDLKGKIWVNTGEIPGNGIDDDQNGYIDDVNGWNFLGNPDGWNQVHAPLEITRLYHQYKNIYENVNPDTLSKSQKQGYEKYEDYKAAYDTLVSDLNSEFNQYAQLAALYKGATEYMKAKLGSDSLTINALLNFESEDKDDEQVKNFLLTAEQQNLRAYILKKGEYFNSRINYHYNLDYHPRDSVNVEQANKRGTGYGNNMVWAGDPAHGTHVAGIIGAIRNNGAGINGVAKNAIIMPVRLVPDGDERDEDVALGIRYAVDNGAKVINMSFGKAYSPKKELVYDAIRYAISKDVLFVHAAGNDAENNSEVGNYPDGTLGGKKSVKGWITVAAGTKNADTNFVADFSNYSRKQVDVLAPGFGIRSLKPDGLTQSLSGTSMASPVIAGVATVLRGVFPDATASEIVKLIEKSISPTKNTLVIINDDEIKLKKVLRYPGVPSLLTALEMGEKKAKK